ncbi:MAG TPA: S41 family peptidase [Candidatus Acidoferrales bacterium]
MRFTRVGSVILLVCLAGAALSAKPVRFARHPDYHSGKIVFSYLGDLWMVNEDGSNPRRLTVHTARDIFPRFSPDGKWIAFTSDRFGNDDVFVMPAAGGEARQLTFHSAGDTVVGWSRDSQRVIFTSSRGLLYPGISNLYEVPATGGLEMPLPTDWGVWGNYSPNGQKLAFNRHPMSWWRQHYRGSYSADLWVMDVGPKTFRKVVDADIPDDRKPNNFWPMYASNTEIFFVSDRETSAKAGSMEVMKSVNNIWKVSDTGGRPSQVTRHRSGLLFHPSISADGKVIVYEENFGIWKLDTASGRSSEVKIDIESDHKENPFEVVTYSGRADSFDLSPTTRRAVIDIRGELFTIATDRGDVVRLTRSYFRDRNPQWSPDGKWIAFTSDQSGRDEIWIIEAEGKNAHKVSDGDSEKFAIVWSPDSKWLAYTASDRRLHLLNVESNQTRVVSTNQATNIAFPQFSPDNQYLSFSKTDRDFRAAIFVAPVSGGEERRLFAPETNEHYSTTAARWTHDGKKMIFLAPTSQGTGTSALWGVALTEEEKDPLSRDIDSEAEAVAAERAAQEQRPQRPGQQAAVEVKIDWEGMGRRARQLTRMSSNVTQPVVAPDSRSYAFVTFSTDGGTPGASIYTINANGEGLRRVTQSRPAGGPGGGGGFGGGLSNLQYSRDGRSIYFREGDAIWAVTVGGAAPAGAAPRPGEAPRRRVNFTVRVEVDHREERKQVYHEAWRVMKNRFYDSEMHGVDWPAVQKRYEHLLEHAASRDDLQDIVRMMLGELNASHTGISGGGGGPGGGPSIQTRYPGFEIEPDASGFYKVAYIYKGGPADRDFVKVSVGDFILAVDDNPLKSGENYWKHYSLAPGRKLEFTVNSKPSMDGAWKTKVEPVSGGAHSTLLYEKWVEERRQMVEKLSNGEIGYLHIRSMNQPSLRQFERDLNANRYKKALIIDQRFNPGGNIDQQLLAILQQGQYQYTRSRDSIYVTRPAQSYFGPMVVMQNERSTSDAEVFPDGFRTLKLGKVVGVTTYGAVIGTGSFRLMDGSQIRTPGSGLWSVTGQNLENYGVPPDVYVDNTPEDFLKRRDAQIEKAVEVLKEEIRKMGRVPPGRQ